MTNNTRHWLRAIKFTARLCILLAIFGYLIVVTLPLVAHDRASWWLVVYLMASIAITDAAWVVVAARARQRAAFDDELIGRMASINERLGRLGGRP